MTRKSKFLVFRITKNIYLNCSVNTGRQFNHMDYLSKSPLANVANKFVVLIKRTFFTFSFKGLFYRSLGVHLLFVYKICIITKVFNWNKKLISGLLIIFIKSFKTLWLDGHSQIQVKLQISLQRFQYSIYGTGTGVTPTWWEKRHNRNFEPFFSFRKKNLDRLQTKLFIHVHCYEKWFSSI